MHHELREFENAAVAAHKAATFIAERAEQSVLSKGTFTFAVSGGHTPWPMFEALSTMNMPWAFTVIYQVDERAAHMRSGERNLTNLRRSLGTVEANIVPMPVEHNLEEGAQAYEELLPERFDLVHLGLGPDGHTASLIPDDPVLEVSDRLVSATGEYQGRRRMTLTYPALARSDQLLWLITGPDQREALARLLEGDTSIPAGRVVSERSLIITDPSALTA
ncbi:MAG: 6-phosphogluconolactonase [Acidimicrobiales bacterium]